jgi:hypothetical protein
MTSCDHFTQYDDRVWAAIQFLTWEAIAALVPAIAASKT